MATESLATQPDQYGADPARGNYTDTSEQHLWCANALATLVAADELSLGELNNGAQQAIRYLLSCEISRAQHAATAERMGA